MLFGVVKKKVASGARSKKNPSRMRRADRLNLKDLIELRMGHACGEAESG